MNMRGYLQSCLLGCLFALPALSSSVQYCRSGPADSPGTEVEFCVGVTQYQNTSTSSHDMYMTLTVPRRDGSALGWTAVGPGSIMEGALMFIVYGDPRSDEQPVVSIRTATGHHQPTLLTQEAMTGGMDLRVTRASWIADADSTSTGGATAWISLICYSCQHWPGTDISAQSTSQPWLWAWNSKQHLPSFAFDAHLDMHKHHAGTGGWGNFYVDMTQSVRPGTLLPALPPIRPGVEKVGVSEEPKNAVVWLYGSRHVIHGSLLAIAFLVVYPGGVVGLRGLTKNGYQTHWILQVVASTLLLVGFSIGVTMRKRLDTVHQVMGIGLTSIVALQSLAGVWHHRRFVQVHRRTWISHVHIWVGRVFILAGWYQVVSGLSLSGYKINSPPAIVAMVTAGFEAGAWAVWTWRRQSVTRRNALSDRVESANAAFALVASDDELEGTEEWEVSECKEEGKLLSSMDD